MQGRGGHNLQLRVEMFNATNTRNFGISEGRVNCTLACTSGREEMGPPALVSYNHLMVLQSTFGLLCSVLVVWAAQGAAPGRVSFSAVATPVPVGQAFEVTVRVDRPTAADCERDVNVVGEFRHEQAETPLRLKGYCASTDGSLFRVGFVPDRAGEYSWRVVYQQGEFQRAGTGSVTVVRQ